MAPQLQETQTIFCLALEEGMIMSCYMGIYCLNVPFRVCPGRHFANDNVSDMTSCLALLILNYSTAIYHDDVYAVVVHYVWSY